MPSSTSINNQGAYNRMYSDVTIPWLYYKLLLHTSLTGQVPFPWDYHGAVYVNSSVAADIPGDKFNMTTSQIPVSNPNTGRRRIAFLSSFWFEHSVGKLLANVAMGLYTNGDELGYIVDIIQVCCLLITVTWCGNITCLSHRYRAAKIMMWTARRTTML